MVSGGTYNQHLRFVPDAPVGEPFYTQCMGGEAWRNGHKMTVRGWYYVDAANKLHGPFAKKIDARKAEGRDG